MKPTLFVEGAFDQWQRVATEMVRRRVDELHMTQDDVAAAGGTKPLNIGKLENVSQVRYRRATIVCVCKGLGWTPNSIERVLAGHEPVLDVGAAGTAIVPLHSALIDEIVTIVTSGEVDEDELRAVHILLAHRYADRVNRRGTGQAASS